MRISYWSSDVCSSDLFDGGKPARTATLRMGDQDTISDLIEQRRNRIRDHIGIKASGIGCHLSEELFQRRCILWKLHIRKVIGKIADPELGKPELLIRSGDRKSARLNSSH